MYHKIFQHVTSKYLKLPQEIKVRADGNDLYINNKLVEDKNRVKLDAESVLDSEALAIVLTAIKEKAEEDIYKNTKVVSDLYFPKASLYVIDSIINQLKVLSNIPDENNFTSDTETTTIDSRTFTM